MTSASFVAWSCAKQKFKKKAESEGTISNWKTMSIKRDYKTGTEDGKELEPLEGPKSPDKEKPNGFQFGK